MKFRTSNLRSMYFRRLVMLAAIGVMCHSGISQQLDDLRDQIRRSPTPGAALQIGRQGDSKDIGLLRAVGERLSPESQRSVRWALARIGDLHAFLDSAADCYDNNGETQFLGFQGMEYIRGTLALRVVADRLTDSVPPARDGDELFWPPRDEALIFLSKMVPDPPITVDYKALTFFRPANAVNLWQDYFKRHPEVTRMPENARWGSVVSECMQKDDYRAIVMLGRLQDPTALELLQPYQSQSGLSTEMRRAIKMVLARLGDSRARDEIKKMTASVDRAVQDEGVLELAYIGGKPGAGALASLLGGNSRTSAAARIGLAHFIPGFPLNGSLAEQQRAVKDWVDSQ